MLTNKTTIEHLKRKAREIRLLTLDMIHKTKSPHIGGSLSMVDLLAALYFKYLNFTPKNGSDPNRDRVILSKGHACASFYATLHLCGIMSKEYVESFAFDDAFLEHHPKYIPEQGLEAMAGSLGHGLSLAAGMAYGFKYEGKPNRVFVILSDGDMNEGTSWEALNFAAQHKLNNLTAIIDFNQIQALGPSKEILSLEPIGEKGRAFNCNTIEINGHDMAQICQAFDQANCSKNKPNLIVAHTTKGKGVSFMENSVLWHYRPPNEEEYKLAQEELFKQ